MGSKAVLRFQGSLEQGFRVILSVRDRQGAEVTEVSGALPAAPELATALATWRQKHRQGLGNSRITVESITVETGSLAQLEACRGAGRQLQQCLLAWLESLAFQRVDRRLREALTPGEAAELVIRTDDPRLHQLPWHCWELVERYPLIEVIFGGEPEQVSAQRSNSNEVRILSILGDRRNIDTEKDRQVLKALPNTNVTFLVEPTRRDINDSLWEQSWDILFFAGHSHSKDQQGYLSLNAEESLTIKELRYGLKEAIAHGLQLAIFNSCDGLGIAYELEQLHIPQLIVMREPVPDEVAQAFLKYFLGAYAGGKPLYPALREARERLQSLETEYPWATWLPVLFQNPASQAPTWQQLQAVPPMSSTSSADSRSQLLNQVHHGSAESATISDVPRPNRPRITAAKVQQILRATGMRLGVGLAFSLAAVGLRYSGLLQTAELAVLDHFHRLQASEPEDDRILVVEIDEDFRQAQIELDPEGRSLTDSTLLELLTSIDKYEPAVIGLDLYRPQATNLQPLVQQYAQNERLIGVCKHSDSDQVAGIASPPKLPSDRQSFSDVPLATADSVARLQLLSATIPGSSPCNSDYSLSGALAYEYFSAKGLELDLNSESNIWRWGQTRFKHIGAAQFVKSSQTYARYGPFSNLKVAGHQLLLNYRLHQRSASQSKDPTQAFLRIKASKVLAGEVNKAVIQDKIILIGVTAPSSDDRWQTPFRTREGEPLEIPGVYLQAQMTSQILSAVEQDRLIWRCLPWTIDALLIVAVGLATALVFPSQRKAASALAIAGFTGILYVTSSGAIALTGIYLPLVPALLASWGASLGCIAQHQARLRQP